MCGLDLDRALEDKRPEALAEWAKTWARPLRQELMGRG
jgi:hypothetical protein